MQSLLRRILNHVLLFVSFTFAGKEDALCRIRRGNQGSPDPGLNVFGRRTCPKEHT